MSTREQLWADVYVSQIEYGGDQAGKYACAAVDRFDEQFPVDVGSSDPTESVPDALMTSVTLPRCIFRDILRAKEYVNIAGASVAETHAIHCFWEDLKIALSATAHKDQVSTTTRRVDGGTTMRTTRAEAMDGGISISKAMAHRLKMHIVNRTSLSFDDIEYLAKALTAAGADECEPDGPYLKDPGLA